VGSPKGKKVNTVLRKTAIGNMNRMQNKRKAQGKIQRGEKVPRELKQRKSGRGGMLTRDGAGAPELRTNAEKKSGGGTTFS